MVIRVSVIMNARLIIHPRRHVQINLMVQHVLMVFVSVENVQMMSVRLELKLLVHLIQSRQKHLLQLLEKLAIHVKPVHRMLL